MSTRLGWLTQINWALAAIVALGAGLRVWNINFGLPYTYAPDEAWHMSVPLHMLKTGDPDPHWLGYPHLAFYLNALAFLIYFGVGRILGMFQSPADLAYAESLTVGVGKLALPSEFLLSRSVTAGFGIASIVLVYLIGARLGRRRSVGLLSALLFAVSPANVYNSHLIRLDTFAVFFLLLATWWIDRAGVEPTMRNYLGAGIGIGLAIAGKYNAGVIALALVAAHWLNFGWRGIISRKELYLAGIASVGAFAVTNPFSILDLPGFFRGLGMASSAQSVHVGMEGNTVQWYADFLWASESLLVLLALAQAARWIMARDKRGIVFLSFPVLYYILINQFAVRNDRTVMLVIPYLDVLAAVLVVEIFERLGTFNRRAARIALALAAGALAFVPLQNSIELDQALAKTDSRETARVWLAENLPPGARVALEAYSPYVDPTHFFVSGAETLTIHSPDWYVANGFEYLVFSYGAYGRFFEAATRYPDVVAQYEMLWTRFPQIQSFNDGGYAVRVHQTGVVNLPAQRVGARFGIFAGWLELVGYDVKTAHAGKPLEIVLHWRTLEARREPVTLTARMLDRDAREIAQTRRALFDANDGGRWADGITRTLLTLDAPLDPGLVRLQLELDAAGQGRVPVLSRTSEPIADKFFLDAIKIAPATPPADELARARPANIRFGETITLRAFMLAQQDSGARITVYWASPAKPTRDYTLFVHVLDAAGNIRAQTDTPPRGGAYPTSLWDAGEIVHDDLTLTLPADLPPGEYRVAIGWYEFPTLTRLPVADARGTNLGDYWILDATLKVTR